MKAPVGAFVAVVVDLLARYGTHHLSEAGGEAIDRGCSSEAAGGTKLYSDGGSHLLRTGRFASCRRSACCCYP